MVNPHEVYLFTDKGKVCFGAIDPSHVILSYFYLNDIKYYETQVEKNKKILIPNFKIISDILTKCKKGEILKLTCDKDILNVVILKEGNDVVLLDTSFKIEYNSNLHDFPNIENLIQFNLDISEFSKELEFQFLLCEDFTLTIKDGVLLFVGETKKISNLEETRSHLHVKPTLKSINKIEKNIAIYLNIDFLKVIHRTLKISERGNIQMNKNSPAIFEFALGNKSGYAKFLISPKVVE